MAHGSNGSKECLACDNDGCSLCGKVREIQEVYSVDDWEAHEGKRPHEGTKALPRGKRIPAAVLEELTREAPADPRSQEASADEEAPTCPAEEAPQALHARFADGEEGTEPGEAPQVTAIRAQPAIPAQHARVPLRPLKEEDEAAAFCTWALGKWHLLAELFVPGHSRKKQKEKPADSKPVTLEAFERWVGTLRFGGDVRAVARAARELDAPATGPVDEEAAEVISLEQLLRLRRHTREMARSALLESLRAKRGSVLRAWRLDLDIKGTGLVDEADFNRLCVIVGHGDHMRAIWDAMRPGMFAVNRPRGARVPPLALCELDPELAATAQQFAEALLARAAFNLDDAWGMLARHDSVRGSVPDEVTPGQFERCAECLGQPAAAEPLFGGLAIGQGRVWREDFEYLWLLAFHSLDPAAQKEGRAPACAASLEEGSGFEEAGGVGGFAAALGLEIGAGPAKATKELKAKVTQRLVMLGYRGDVRRAVLRLLLALLRSRREPSKGSQAGGADSVHANEWDSSTMAPMAVNLPIAWCPRKQAAPANINAAHQLSMRGGKLLDNGDPSRAPIYGKPEKGLETLGFAYCSVLRSSCDPHRRPNKHRRATTTHHLLGSRNDMSLGVQPKIAHRPPHPARIANATPFSPIAHEP